MAVTDDELLAERMRVMRLHGMSRDAWNRYARGGSWAYDILAAGFKYNLTDIAASIGIHQLKRCDAFHARRRLIASRYTEAFSNVQGLQVPAAGDEMSHAWHLYVLRVEPEALTIDRDAFIRALSALDIGASVHFIPLHLHRYYRHKYGYFASHFPNASAASRRILSLPLYPRMTDQDVEDVIGAVRGIAEEHAR